MKWIIMQPAISRAPTGGSGLYRGLLERRPFPLPLRLLPVVSEWLWLFPAQKPVQKLLPAHLQIGLDHVYPRNEPVLQSNLSAVFLFCSFSLPFLKTTSFGVGHRSSSYRVSISIWKLNDNTKQITSGICLAQNVIYRVFTFGFCPLDKRPTKTHFFNFFGGNVVVSDMFDAIFRPEKLPNLHLAIVSMNQTITNQSMV
jgi:hypothetical protein